MMESKHTDSFIVKDANGRQYTVHELTEEGGAKRYELRNSPGTIRRIGEKTFQIEFPFAKTVIATVA